MTIRCKTEQGKGTRTFLVGSERKAGVEYAVEYVRNGGTRRFFCSCPDFQYRKVRRKRLCKHARRVATLARVVRGVTRLHKAVATLQANAVLMA